ncbi:methyltransferase-like protein 5 isoform X2 [Pseudomyrmex gracilis]|uniref:methyltransferase-like protein 5 isoform X2 n=1 Tax=Pseudomyrmex gracilis TaxID=219809 RepID=UPI00099547A1|nr:methyltransferase-like protein 5 isoform X2 [Pseudomyrmex gracilis]
MTCLRLCKLEEYLQQLDVFKEPKVLLEQYATSAHIASHMLYTAQSQFNDIEEIVQCDVLQYLPGKFEKFFDTVVMNPPFGTKNNTGIDVRFLEAAIKLTSNVVYSLHKSSTRDYILSKAAQFGAKGTVIAKLRYDLPRAYKFHKKASVDIQVDFIRFEVNR